MNTNIVGLNNAANAKNIIRTVIWVLIFSVFLYLSVDPTRGVREDFFLILGQSRAWRTSMTNITILSH